MILTDLRTIKRICRKHGLTCDAKYKYITNTNAQEDFIVNLRLNKEGYKLKYVSGCFYPYLFKLEV